MKLNQENLCRKAEWEEKGYTLPGFDREAMIRKTKEQPSWIHFGAGNIFRAFQANACQHLLDTGQTDTGIIAVDRHEKHDENDNLFVRVTLCSDGRVKKAVIGSIAEKVSLGSGMQRLRELFENPSLQLVSFTITEKGYSLVDSTGEYMPDVAADLAGSPETAQSYMGKLTALLYARFTKTKKPLALVSMDNCSRNGDRLKAAVNTFARAWDDQAFLRYLAESVSFPWTMIDKITPAPDESVAAMLAADNLPAKTPFVNAEESEYLVIEDSFPNGRPPLEKAGIYCTDREVVDQAERMKVCTCLNPLHTSLAVFGCLLGYRKIWEEMQDKDLVRLIKIIGYSEGLPASADPGIIHPKEFLDTVVRVRFPNPFLPDTPQRIAADTSQKLPIRFGETIKTYLASDTLSTDDLEMIPLVFAGWLRYLMAVDDSGRPFEPSPDPLLSYAQAYVADIRLGETPDPEKISGLLSNAAIFGVDLTKTVLADKVCAYFSRFCQGKGAVRKTLSDCVNAYCSGE